jgi:hypothetical protein
MALFAFGEAEKEAFIDGARQHCLPEDLLLAHCVFFSRKTAAWRIRSYIDTQS